MSESSDPSDYFRNKVWYIINTIQANQLFVHSANLKVRYSEEEMLFLDKKKLKSKKKSSKKKTRKLHKRYYIGYGKEKIPDKKKCKQN
ncbi:hypothetical protein ES708_22013 [subsurface metagenome]